MAHKISYICNIYKTNKPEAEQKLAETLTNRTYREPDMVLVLVIIMYKIERDGLRRQLPLPSRLTDTHDARCTL